MDKGEGSMKALGMAIRPSPRRWSRLIPLPRGDTGEPSEGREGNRGVLRKATGMGPPGWSVMMLGCGMGRGGPPMRRPREPSEGREGNREILRKATGIGPPVRFGRARESIGPEVGQAGVFLLGSRAPLGQMRGIGPPGGVGRAACSTTGTGPPRAHSEMKRGRRRPRDQVLLLKRPRKRLARGEPGRGRTYCQTEEFIPRRRDPIGAPSLPRTTAADRVVSLVPVMRFHGNVLCREDSAQVFSAVRSVEEETGDGLLFPGDEEERARLWPAICTVGLRSSSPRSPVGERTSSSGVRGDDEK